MSTAISEQNTDIDTFLSHPASLSTLSLECNAIKEIEPAHTEPFPRYPDISTITTPEQATETFLSNPASLSVLSLAPGLRSITIGLAELYRQIALAILLTRAFGPYSSSSAIYSDLEVQQYPYPLAIVACGNANLSTLRDFQTYVDPVSSLWTPDGQLSIPLLSLVDLSTGHVPWVPDGEEEIAKAGRVQRFAVASLHVFAYRDVQRPAGFDSQIFWNTRFEVGVYARIVAGMASRDEIEWVYWVIRNWRPTRERLSITYRD